jgi:hypothetical protein
MEECDKRNSHTSSKLHIICITKYVLFCYKNSNFTWALWPQDTLRFVTTRHTALCDHKTHCAFSLFVNVCYQQPATAPTPVRNWDVTLSERYVETPGVWKKLLRVMESSVATFTVLYCTNVILLKFNSLALFYVIDMIYLLTAIWLTPGGSSTDHIYTQTI